MIRTIKRLFLSLGRLELTAFVAGFCLLAYELVAARILAPFVGSSIYVWTSVIGVIILALSLGYAFGGWLADKRVRTADVAFLLLTAAGGVCLTLILYNPIASAIVLLVGDPRLQGLFASFILFAPTSFILGSISPYLARLKLKSITSTGRVVASLSAINSLGGITGTLVTGFILFGYIGSNQILALLTAVLIAVSWLMTPRHRKHDRTIISLVLLGVAILALAPPLPKNVLADIDTPSARYQVQEITSAKKPFRVLKTGPGAWQSGSFTDGSSELVFWYTREMADIVRQAPRHDNILILGGGALSLPRYLSQKYPDAKITVVEIDPELAGIAKNYFYYEPAENIKIVSEDARAFLEKNDKTYDSVLVDAFSEMSIPFSLTTKEYTAALQKATHPGSQVVVNLIVSNYDACGELFSGLDASYRESFSQAAYFPEMKDDLNVRQNVIAVYGNQPLLWLNQADSIKKPPPSPSFSDNFTPSDRLNFECRLQNS